ncbi:MAG: hypothetical protein ACREYE_11410, partial [Gammaproteobacteria bacterium]
VVDIIKKIERARVKMEQIKLGSTLPRGKKEGGLTVKLFKGHYIRRERPQWRTFAQAGCQKSAATEAVRVERIVMDLYFQAPSFLLRWCQH